MQGTDFFANHIIPALPELPATMQELATQTLVLTATQLTRESGGWTEQLAEHAFVPNRLGK